MAVQVSYPGVYIEEFAPGPPIQGVSTSNAAFIGVAARGEIAAALGDTFQPAKVTSWDRFKQLFGEQPVPGFFLWYAVRGFFENGGKVCYVVRASNGRYDEVILNDRVPAPNANPLIRIKARQPGDNSSSSGKKIEVEVTEAHVIPNTTKLFRPTSIALNADATTGSREVTLRVNQAVNFKPDDVITIATGGERLRVLGISGDKLRLASSLAAGYKSADPVRLADIPAGARTIRIHPTAALQPNTLVAGTILTITQGAVSDSQIVEAVQTEPMGSGVPTYRVTFRQGLRSPFSLGPAAVDAVVKSEEFNLIISEGGTPTPYDNLSIDPAHPRYFVRIINDANGLVEVELIEPPPPVEPPNNLPVAVGPLPPVFLKSGANENLVTIGDQDYINALDVLRRVDDVNLIAIPDRITANVQQALITHCEQMADRFAVLDARRGLGVFGSGSGSSIGDQRREVDSTRGYAALYYPWLRVAPAGTGAPILVPPSGHVCGIMARSDNIRGVHKAPANEIVNGALGVERRMSDTDQGVLNLDGINVIRLFQTGGRPVLWGARTTATDLNWQYVNIRRLFLFAEESIQEGIRYAIFEPNNLQLWKKLTRSITAFLTRIWRDGALFGAKAEDAFYVRIDEVLNPFSEQALGRLNIEIGLRPAYPAEFIIVRIGIWPGGSEVTEA